MARGEPMLLRKAGRPERPCLGPAEGAACSSPRAAGFSYCEPCMTARRRARYVQRKAAKQITKSVEKKLDNGQT
jgi:hypothetical protein